MSDISLVNGLPRHKGANVLTERDVEQARFTNQFLLKGASPQFPNPFGDKDYIVFLEFVQSTGTFNIEDADANAIATGVVTGFGDAHAPIRLDGGVKLVGTILAAKGFYVRK